MALEFKLPEIGEGVVEGEIVEWHVAVGDAVSPDQPLLSVLTDKATVEIASSFSGVIQSLKFEGGDVAEVDAVLLTYGEAGEEAPVAVPEAPKNAGQAKVANQQGQGSLVEFPLPEIGEGVVEGELVEWMVAVGDHVSADQPILAIQTDKATVDITMPVDGTIVELRGEPGEMLVVGDVIMTMNSNEGTPASAAPVVTEDAEPIVVAAPVAAKTAVSPEDNPSISAFGTPLATPAVRRLAASKGIDLSQIVGSGPNHRITREDVDQFVAQPASTATTKTTTAPAPKPAPAPVAVSAHPEAETREKIRGLRKAIHTSMTRSKGTIPHFTYVDEVEMDKLIAMRKSLKVDADAMGVKLTYLPFIVKAVVTSLKKFPILNASVDDTTDEIVYKNYYNMGIATATPAGLTVPVLKDADRKPILQIAKEIAELSDRARNKRSTMDDVTGGTFTITSLGRLGGLFATPIINHPEVGILGIHNLQERAVVRNGEIVVRQMMNISVSFDHRIVDGDVGATFAQEVKNFLEEPGRLLLHMT